MEMPEGFKNYLDGLTTHDLRFQDQAKAADLLKEMAEALDAIESYEGAYPQSIARVMLQKFKEWK